MGKRRPLPTRAFGAEPGIPDVPDLAGWVAEQRERGEAGDLTLYRLGRSLEPQLEAGIAAPCAGGKFYRERLLSSFTGIEEGVITGETEVSLDDLVADAAELAGQKKGVWCAMPAPALMGLADRYYGADDEAGAAVFDLYRSAMRAMRDAGAGGHVLICDRAGEQELAALARQKVFFFNPAPQGEDLGLLLEYQDRIAVGRDYVGKVFALAGEYEVRQLIITDADEASVALALSHLDPDQVVIGGYCTDSCSTYWEDVVNRAFYLG
jgi:hypothetical protein